MTCSKVYGWLIMAIWLVVPPHTPPYTWYLCNKVGPCDFVLINGTDLWNSFCFTQSCKTCPVRHNIYKLKDTHPCRNINLVADKGPVDLITVWRMLIWSLALSSTRSDFPYSHDAMTGFTPVWPLTVLLADSSTKDRAGTAGTVSQIYIGLIPYDRLRSPDVYPF